MRKEETDTSLPLLPPDIYEEGSLRTEAASLRCREGWCNLCADEHRSRHPCNTGLFLPAKAVFMQLAKGPIGLEGRKYGSVQFAAALSLGASQRLCETEGY